MIGLLLELSRTEISKDHGPYGLSLVLGAKVAYLLDSRNLFGSLLAYIPSRQWTCFLRFNTIGTAGKLFTSTTLFPVSSPYSFDIDDHFLVVVLLFDQHLVA